MIIELWTIFLDVKEEQNHHKKSEQLNFLNGTINETAKENKQDYVSKSSSNSEEEPFEVPNKKPFLKTVLILDTEKPWQNRDASRNTVTPVL